MALTCSYYRNYKKDLSEINSNIRLEIFVPWFKVKLSDETKVNLLRKRSAIYNNKLVLLGLFSSNSSRCKMLAFGTESKSKKQSVGSPGHARSPDPNTLLEVCLHWVRLIKSSMKLDNIGISREMLASWVDFELNLWTSFVTAACFRRGYCGTALKRVARNPAVNISIETSRDKKRNVG